MQKYLILVCIFLWILGCSNTYTSFHDNLQSQKEIFESHDDSLSKFDFSQIQTLSWVSLEVTPDKKWLENFVTKIDTAEEKVWIEVYIFTEKRLQKAVINAKKRGVDVKVILEKNVYKAPSMNKKIFAEFEKNGIEVVWSDSKDYSLNHSKMAVIDDEVIVSTGNYSYSTFAYNREFFLVMKNPDFQKIMEEIFLKDFDWEKFALYHPNLVLSPFSSRHKMEYLIQNAQKTLHIYALNFWDEKMRDLLIKKQKSGVKVEIILPDTKKVASNSDEIEAFTSAWIAVKMLKKPEAHAKAILSDGKYLYVGSVNFSAPSMDLNREIGIVLKNPEIISEFLEIFHTDF